MFTRLMVDRYRFEVADADVSCSCDRPKLHLLSLVKSFRSGVDRSAFILVDGWRVTSTRIESVTFCLPENPRATVLLQRSGAFVLSSECDREEVWSLLNQCIKGRGSGHSLQMKGAPIQFTEAERSMLAG